jgi:hypothetical protein
MCYKTYFSLLFLFVFGSTVMAQDTLKNRFSIGFGKTYVNYYLNGGSNEIIQKKPLKGVYVKLDFMWKRVGFSTGLQVMNRDFYEKFPETALQYKLLGYKHISGITAVPFYMSYKMLDRKVLRVFVQTGMVYSSIHDDVTAEFNYSPVYSKPYETKHRFFSWSTGLDVEVNLYKRDVWLSTQVQYVGEPVNGHHNKRLLCNAGLKIAVSNILHKDAVNSLKSMNK